MRKFLKTFLFIFLLILLNHGVRSQTLSTTESLTDQNIRINKPENPEFNTVSGNYVDLFTGAPSYNINLFNMQRGSFSIPINLSYKTNGIQVSDQASFVGLGWDLNYGGMITKSSEGREDNMSAGYSSTYGYINDEGFGMEPISYEADNTTKLLDYSNAAGPSDGEADIFSIEAFGISGKFVLENYQSSNPTVKKLYNGKYKVKVFKEENLDKPIDSIIVTSYQGHTIVFATKNSIASRQTKMINIEESRFLDNYNTFSKPNGEWASYPSARPNTWYISRVDFNNGLPSIKFEYEIDINLENFTHRTIVYYSHNSLPENLLHNSADDNDNYTMLSDHYTIYDAKPRIRKIEWGNDYIDFIPATDRRKDFNVGDTYSIQEVVLSHKDENGIISEIKRWRLHHSYFKPESNDTYYLSLLDEVADNDFRAANFKRLRLDSLELISENQKVPSYEFSYYDTHCLPYKQSTNIDFWGFYKSLGDSYNVTSKPLVYIYPNNNELIDCGNPYSNGSLPFNGRYSVFDRQITDGYETIDGLDRNSSLVDAQTYALKTIKLQEGGHIKFNYELHDFSLDGNTHSGGGLRVSKVSLYNENLNLPDLEYNFSYTKHNSPDQSSGFLYSIPAYAKTDWKTRQSYYNGSVDTEQQLLSRRTIRFNMARNLQSHRGSYVGYDRVSFKNSENNGKTDYHFSSVDDILQTNEGIFDLFYQGYVYIENYGGGDTNIPYPINVYEEYEHVSPADLLMVNYGPHPFLPQPLLNNIGMNDSVLVYNNDGDYLKKQVNLYSRYLNDDKIYGFKSQLYDSYSWNWWGEWIYEDKIIVDVDLSLFDLRSLSYWFDCETIRKHESADIQYFDNNEVKNFKNYEYASEWMSNNYNWATEEMLDNVSSYVRHEKTTNSKDQTVHKYTRYSFEFADVNNTNHPDSRVNAIIWMNTNKNYKPIETISTLEKDGKEYVTEAIIYTYEIVDDNLFNRQIYKTEIGTSNLLYSDYESAWIDNNATENSFHFDSNCRLQYTIDRYDEYGNVIEQHNINNIHTSIIYAYDNKYPVIVANNSTYDDLKTASDIALNAAGFNSFEEITTLSTEQQRSKWNAFNENLRNHLSNSELSTYSYIPLVGMSSEVDWNNKVTYYQYDRLQRLETVRDSDYNVLKHVDIEYK